MSPKKTMTIAVLEPPTRTALQVARHSAEALESLGHRAPRLLYKEDRLRSRLPIPALFGVELALSRRGLTAWLEKIEPELILVVKGERISAGTIEWVKRKTGIRWACWYIDDPVHLPTSKALSPHYDFFFTTDPDSARAHREAGSQNVGVLPYACHPPIHRPVELSLIERASLASEVAFVGTIGSANRRDVLEAVASRFDLKVWGGKTGRYVDREGRVVEGDLELSPDLAGSLTGKWAWEEEMPRIYAAAEVVLNVQHPDRLNMRLFEATACGSFLLTDGRDYVGEFFEADKEVALYDGPGDVAEQIAYWLARPEERAAVAEAAFRRAHRDHTYARRMETLLEACFSPGACG